MIDFFVHPEHDRKHYPYKKIYKKYIEGMTKAFENSECPVLIDGYNKGNFDALFTPENTLASASHRIYCELINDRGEINPKDWKRFTEMVDQHNEFRVHGTYLAECTEGFAVQLFGYIKYGDHWHNWCALHNKDAFQKEESLRKHHERRGDFRDCGINFGHVLAPRKYKIQKPNIIRKLIGIKPHGNITHQLIDDKTVIYRP